MSRTMTDDAVRFDIYGPSGREADGLLQARAHADMRKIAKELTGRPQPVRDSAPLPHARIPLK